MISSRRVLWGHTLPTIWFQTFLFGQMPVQLLLLTIWQAPWPPWTSVSKSTKGGWYAQHLHSSWGEGVVENRRQPCGTPEAKEPEGRPCFYYGLHVKGKQLLPPMCPGAGTGSQVRAEEQRLGCVTSMLGGGKQRQATWELGAREGLQAIGQLITDPHSEVFLSAPEVMFSRRYCFPWPLPLIRRRKTASTITLRPPALPAACLPGWSPCLLCPFLFLLPETVIQAKMSVGPELSGLIAPPNLGPSAYLTYRVLGGGVLDA